MRVKLLTIVQSDRSVDKHTCARAESVTVHLIFFYAFLNQGHKYSKNASHTCVWHLA